MALEAEAGIPELVSTLGSGESPPGAPSPEPVDRYQLMRAFRKRARQGIAFWRIRDQIEAARQADVEVEAAARAEEREREAAQETEQKRLDDLWSQLQKGRAGVETTLPGKVAEEKQRRDAARAAEQQELDAEWTQLLENDPAVTLPALEAAFADNESPAAAIDCDGKRTTVVMQFASPEAIVPERKPSRTPTGKRTLKKRTKTEINALYLEALGSNVLATVKEALAVAPGTEIVQLLVIRRETEKTKNAGHLAAVYVGEFNRAGYESANPHDPGRSLALAPESMLNLEGENRAGGAARPERAPRPGGSARGNRRGAHGPCLSRSVDSPVERVPSPPASSRLRESPGRRRRSRSWCRRPRRSGRRRAPPAPPARR